MKCTQEEYTFHQRALAADPTAFSELAEGLYASLVRDTGVRARSRLGADVDMALIEEAVGQALLDYNDQPQRYDPEQASMHTYFVMCAHRDYLNASAKERRHTSRQAIPPADSPFEPEDTRQELDGLLTRISAQELWPAVESVFHEGVDRQLVVMLMNGVRSTESYARVLGLGGLPADEQAREVKRAKDRITKRLRRIGEAYDGRV